MESTSQNAALSPTAASIREKIEQLQQEIAQYRKDAAVVQEQPSLGQNQDLTQASTQAMTQTQSETQSDTQSVPQIVPQNEPQSEPQNGPQIEPHNVPPQRSFVEYLPVKVQFKVAKHKKSAPRSKIVQNMSLVNEPAQSAGFVQRYKRSAMQLVNKEVFQQQQEHRAQRLKLLQLKKKIMAKELEQKQMMAKFNSNKLKYEYCDWINIYGDASEAAEKGYGMYAVVNNGLKLVPLSKDPKCDQIGAVVEVQGKKYVRNAVGELIDSNMGHGTQSIVYCRWFTSTGDCKKGPNCPFVHDKEHRAICRKFLKNACVHSRETCFLSHSPNEHNSPVCTFNLNKSCTKEHCHFMHTDIDISAKICRPFALTGWCSRGKLCQYKHLFECPDFVDYGRCTRRNCKLSHRKPVGVYFEDKQLDVDNFLDSSDEEIEMDADDDDDNDDGAAVGVKNSGDDGDTQMEPEKLSVHKDNEAKSGSDMSMAVGEDLGSERSHGEELGSDFVHL